MTPKIIKPRISTTKSKKNRKLKAPIISPNKFPSFRAYPFPDDTAILQIKNNVQAGIRRIGIRGETFKAGKIQAIRKNPTPQIKPSIKRNLKLGASTSIFSNISTGAFLAKRINKTVKIRNPKKSFYSLYELFKKIIQIFMV